MDKSPEAQLFGFFSVLCVCACDMSTDKCLTTLAEFRSPVVRHCHYVFIVMVWQLSAVENLNYFFVSLTLKTRVDMISQFGMYS